MVAILMVTFVGDDAWRALVQADPALLVGAFVCYALFFVVRGVRWAVLVRPFAPRVSVLDAASLTGFGWLVSTFIPMKAGDVARAAMLARRERAAFAHIGGAVAIERLLDLFGLALVASFGLLAGRGFLADRLPPFLGHALLVGWTMPLLGFAALVLLAVWMSRHPSSSRLARFVARFADAFASLVSRWRQLPLVLLLTILVCATQIAVFVLVFFALYPGAALAPVLVGVPLFLLTFVASFVPGNVGTYEAGFVLAFMLVGFDPATLLPAAVAAHVLTMTFVTILGATGYGVHATLRPVPAAPPAEATTPA